MINNKIQYDLCFETLSNELRIKILKSLSEKPKTVSEIVNELDVEQSRLSHSLSMLRDCNYVNVEKVGKQRIYSIKDGILDKKNGNIFENINSHVNEYCKECGKIKKGVGAQ